MPDCFNTLLLGKIPHGLDVLYLGSVWQSEALKLAEESLALFREVSRNMRIFRDTHESVTRFLAGS